MHPQDMPLWHIYRNSIQFWTFNIARNIYSTKSPPYEDPQSTDISIYRDLLCYHSLTLLPGDEHYVCWGEGQRTRQVGFISIQPQAWPKSTKADQSRPKLTKVDFSWVRIQQQTIQDKLTKSDILFFKLFPLPELTTTNLFRACFIQFHISMNMFWCLVFILEILVKSNQCWIEHEIIQFTIQYILIRSRITKVRKRRPGKGGDCTPFPYWF